MAKIVVISGSVPSIQRPNAEFARRLTSLGHTVTFVSTPDFAETAAEIGIDFIATNAARRVDPVEPMPTGGWPARLRSVRARRRAAVDHLNEDQIAGLVTDLQPDLVVVEVELVSQILALRARGLALAALTIFPHAYVDPKVPALHTTAIPGRGRTGSGRAILLRWRRFQLGLRLDLLKQFVRAPGDHRRSQLRRLAKRLGIDTSELDFDQWIQPLVLTSVPLVSMSPRPFDFPRHGSTPLLETGPMLLKTGRAEQLPAPVAAFVSQRRGRKLIYASFGAFHGGDDSAFVKRLVTAVERRTDWELIVGLGGRSDVEAFGATASNVHLLPWAPQREILEVADAAVIHGGYSSVHESIQARVPMLLHPFGIDQPGNAARVVHHGLGILGDRAQDTPEIIGSHIDRLLTEASFCTSVSAMADLTEPDDDSDLEATIDALLERGNVANGRE